MQVSQEVYVTVTRKLSTPLASEVAYRVVQDLRTVPVWQTPERGLSAIRRSFTAQWS